MLVHGAGRDVAETQRDVCVERCGLEAAVELEMCAGFFGRIDQRDIEPAATDRPDHLAVVATVAQQFGVAVAVMHHAPAHHHRESHHFIGEAGNAQSVQTALGECKIDRSPTRVTSFARIGSTLEYVDRKSSLRKQGRQQ